MRTEDGYIIRQCLNGEKEAFGFLVDKYKASIYAFAYSKLHNFHDPEDITQEAFIIAFKKLHTLKRWDSFLAWLYSITYNLCKKFIIKKSNRLDIEFIEDQQPEFLSIPAMDSYQEQKMHEMLYSALAELPERINTHLYPMLRFGLSHNRHTATVEAYVDTGAAHSIFVPSIAQQINLDYRSSQLCSRR